MSDKTNNEIVLDVQNLKVDYPVTRKKKLHAVVDVSFQIKQGQTMGLVGESGCGKSSLARAIMQLPPPSSGKVLFCGEELTKVTKQRLRQLRPNFQIVFQDYISALNPIRKIGNTISMPLFLSKKEIASERKKRALSMMNLVGIDLELFERKPHELSGGQCQRVQIARALITTPKLLILDEPVSSLDVSIQGQIINLLEKLRNLYGLTMLFISHDLSVVKNVCDTLAIMYLGRLFETGSSEKIYNSPLHPYTKALFSAIPQSDPFQQSHKLPLITGEILSASTYTSGCRFKTRCPEAVDYCETREPHLREIYPGHLAACHLLKSTIMDES